MSNLERPSMSPLRYLSLRLCEPWLVADLGCTHDVLSWSLNRPGFTSTRQIVWRQVRNADLPRELDPKQWLMSELKRDGLSDAVAMMTSREIIRHDAARVAVEAVSVECVATVGLSNAERIGRRRSGIDQIGTINVLVKTSVPLTQAAMVEAISIVAEARTVAVLDGQHDCGSGVATGTGTDCIVVAAPRGGDAHAYAGLHTPLGEALGRAVRAVVGVGVATWLKETV